MKTIIFDFDGTITNIHSNWPQTVDLINGLLQQYRLRTFSSDEILALQNMSSLDIYKQLKIPFYKAPFVVPRLLKNFQKVYPQPEPFPGMLELIKTLSNAFEVGIITSNSQENVASFLAKYKLENLFSFVITGVRLFGKPRQLKKIIKERSLSKDACIYIGDETRDIDAAQKVGILSGAVTWGINSRQVLEAHTPSLLIDEPKQLEDFLRSYM